MKLSVSTTAALLLLSVLPCSALAEGPAAVEEAPAAAHDPRIAALEAEIEALKARMDQDELQAMMERAALAAEGHALMDHPAAEVSAPTSIPERFEAAETPLDRLEVVQEALAEDEAQGLHLLLALLQDPETPPFCRDNARGLLVEHVGQDFGYEAQKGENTESLRAFADWLAQRDGAAVE